MYAETAMRYTDSLRGLFEMSREQLEAELGVQDRAHLNTLFFAIQSAKLIL